MISVTLIEPEAHSEQAANLNAHLKSAHPTDSPQYFSTHGASSGTARFRTGAARIPFEANKSMASCKLAVLGTSTIVDGVFRPVRGSPAKTCHSRSRHIMTAVNNNAALHTSLRLPLNVGAPPTLDEADIRTLMTKIPLNLQCLHLFSSDASFEVP
jgi:hypothetical protein